ncbi:hypothetical protein AOQ84DRAFT_381433 [Glonium stellatum]|uniref:Uncharacterized protein n=1 Tax=Glonium stellatum TaxID=574774 RepID=A0A8E2ES68_9PEZI|nr:hypothetical protein AOQ84DRAFT_381433 [Glonium stellatum]
MFLTPTGLELCSPLLPSTTILLVTLNYPDEMKNVLLAGHAELDMAWKWTLIAGDTKAFSTGADLM